jgi:Zn-finger nucleic acid-binding protein
MVSCPVCRKKMQPFWVPAGPSREIELDRCNECGGVWFDAGELERATRRKLKPGGAAKATRRNCPRCKTAMVTAQLDSGITVESCQDCFGTFLEAVDLEQATKRAPPKAEPKGMGFTCEGCGERKPFSEGEATVSGLVCAACRAEPSEEAPAPAPAETKSAFGRLVSWLTSA